MTERGSETVETAEDDARLVAQAKGDPAAFAALYRRYVAAVYRYCSYRLATREQAEDATSQIFERALSALPSYRGDATFRSWLFAIAHNVVSDRHRTRRPVWPLSLVAERPAHGPSVEEEALESVARDELRALLDCLSGDQRRVLELRLAGLTSAEIARVLGKRQGAVKVAQSRAIARIRKSLARDRDVGNKSEERLDVGA